MKKKWIPLTMVLALLISLFAGCGGTPSISEAQSSPPSVQETTQDAVASAEVAAVEPEVSVSEEAAAPIYEKIPVEMPIGDGESISMFLLVPPFVSPMLGEVGNLSVLKELSTRSGVKFDIIEGSYLDGQNAINLMMAAGDYADVINHADLYAAGIDAAVNEDIIIDLSEYIKNDMPNLMASLMSYDTDVLKQITTSSGYMPYFPQLHKAPIVDNFLVGYRQDLMEQQGLATPKTYDEFHDVLLQIHEAYGLQYGMDPGGFDQALLTGMNLKPGTVGVEAILLKDGKVEMSCVTDEIYDYFSMIAQWYGEELVFGDFISYDTFDQTKMISSGELFGNGNVNAQTISEANASGTGAVVEGIPYLTKTGSNEIKVFGTGEIVRSAAWSVSSQAENVDLIVSLVDYLFSEDGDVLFNYGVENEAYVLDENGEPTWSDLVLNYEGGTTTAAFLYATATPTEYLPGSFDDSKFNYSYTDAMTKAEDYIASSSTGEYDFPMGAENRISSEDSVKAANISSDINTYISQTVLTWIHGQQPLTKESFQTYVDTCYSMGLQDVIDIYQQAYEDFIA